MCHLYNSCLLRTAVKPGIVQPSHTEWTGVMSKARVWEWEADQALLHCIFMMSLAFFPQGHLNSAMFYGGLSQAHDLMTT